MKTLLAPAQEFTDAPSFVAAYPFTVQPIMEMILKNIQTSMVSVSNFGSFSFGSSSQAKVATYQNTISNDGSPESDLIANAFNADQPFSFRFQLKPMPAGMAYDRTFYSATGAIGPQYNLYAYTYMDLKASLSTAGQSGSSYSQVSWDWAIANKQTIWNYFISMITGFNAYSPGQETNFTEIYGVSDPSTMANNTISYVVSHDMPPAPAGEQFSPAPNTVDFWSKFFTYPEGQDLLATAAQKGVRGFDVVDTVYPTPPSSVAVTDSSSQTQYMFALGFSDFQLQTYAGNKIIVSYNRQTVTETVDIQKEKTSFFYYIAIAVAIAIVAIAVVSIAAPALITGTGASASAASSTAATVGTTASTSVGTSGAGAFSISALSGGSLGTASLDTGFTGFTASGATVGTASTAASLATGTGASLATGGLSLSGIASGAQEVAGLATSAYKAVSSIENQNAVNNAVANQIAAANQAAQQTQASSSNLWEWLLIGAGVLALVFI